MPYDRDIFESDRILYDIPEWQPLEQLETDIYVGLCYHCAGTGHNLKRIPERSQAENIRLFRTSRKHPYI